MCVLKMHLHCTLTKIVALHCEPAPELGRVAESYCTLKDHACCASIKGDDAAGVA